MALKVISLKGFSKLGNMPQKAAHLAQSERVVQEELRGSSWQREISVAVAVATRTQEICKESSPAIVPTKAVKE